MKKIYKKNKIKILVGYHVPYQLLNSEVYLPMHAGRDVAFESSNIKTLNKNATVTEQRAPAYISEYLTSIFILKFKKEHVNKVKELDCTYFIKNSLKNNKLQLIKRLWMLICGKFN